MSIVRVPPMIRVMVLLVACTATIGAPASPAGTPEPNDLVDEAMDYLGFDDSHRQAILDGEILFTGMPGLEPLPQAVAVAGAMMIIRRPWEELIDLYLKEESFRTDPHLLGSGRIPEDSPTASWTEEVAYTSAERKELARMLEVKPGGTFNFSESEIERFRAIPRGDAAEDKALALFRDLLSERVGNYRTKGVAGITPYARGNGRQASPAEELTAAMQDSDFLRRHFPEFHGALDRYPEGSDSLTSSRYYWTKKEVSGRPSVALVHKTLWVGESACVVGEREFYVGQGYNTMFTVVGAVPYGDGTLLIAANRTFSERVTGMGRSLKKTMGRKVVAAKFAERFEYLRSAFEQDRRPD